MTLLVAVTVLLACAGLAQAVVGWWLVRRFIRRAAATTVSAPPVTMLKPLYGDEPLLEAALATSFRQDYPVWQIVFGVANPSDPAIEVVERLRARFPGVDATLVVDPTLHGRNRKVGNLINMLPHARHDILVIADSDVHARPDYLLRLMDALARPGIGLVTTLYAGLPSHTGLAASLGAMHISSLFLPSALLARALGRQDCLGATMALRRDDLERIGGLPALLPHLADDAVLGQRIRRLGLGVALADTIPLTTVPETSLRALFRHELRWARTIRTLEPAGFAASVLQYPLFWTLLTVALTSSAWSVGIFGVAWMLRAAAATGVNSALLTGWWAGVKPADDTTTLAFRSPIWLLPLRDIFSVVVLLASYAGRHVDWRGHGLTADSPPPLNNSDVSLRPLEGIRAP